MNRLNYAFAMLLSLLLVGCGELYYCPNPNQVVLVNYVPRSTCCKFVGWIDPCLNLDNTFPHKLKCLAPKINGNVVVTSFKDVGLHHGYRVYQCDERPGCICPKII